MLSLALATYNEEKNLAGCLESVKALADEIIVVDGGSKDHTVEIARKFGAKVIVTNNPAIFHINKQKAIDACLGDWILQLDADEQVSPELAKEIKKVIHMSQKEIEKYQNELPERELFLRHQNLNSEFRIQNSELSSKSRIINYKLNSELLIHNFEFAAFYISRKNYFLGKFLRYGGVYPDGVIRLFKKGKARLPCRDVHELMEVDGKVGWLQNSLLHYDSPTFKRYLERNSRYINRMVDEMKEKKTPKNVTLFFCYFGKCISWFLMTTFRHKGILDGWQGIIFSLFSALRFPRAYIRYLRQSLPNRTG